MKVKIFSSNTSYADLENQISKWTDELNPTIISVDLNCITGKQPDNDWVDYTAAIIYTT